MEMNLIFFNTNRPECQDQVNGFQGAKFKKFSTREEAESYISSTNASPPDASRLSSNKLLKSKLPDVISTDISLPSFSIMKRSEKNYYAVAVGKTPGIFSNW